MERIDIFILVSLVCCLPLVFVALDTRNILTAPALFAYGALVLMLPQYYVASTVEWRVSEEAYLIYTFVVISCTLAFYIGYYLRPRHAAATRSPRSGAPMLLAEDKLFKFGLVVGGLGLLGAILLGPANEVEVWRGWPVYYYTLSKFVYPGLTLLVFSAFLRPTQAKLVIIGILLIVPIYQAVFLGRRSALLGTPLLFLVPLMHFFPRYRPSALLFFGSSLLALIIVYAVPFWREEFVHGGHLDAISRTTISEVIDAFINPANKKTLETIDSMNLTLVYYLTNGFEWGAGVYDQLIQNYFAGSIFGRELKQSLMFGGGPDSESTVRLIGTEIAFYTGKSAFADLYTQFSFLTPGVFFAIGRIFRRICDRVLLYRDDRAALILAAFASIPLSLSWSQITVNLTLELPKILIMLYALRYCSREAQMGRPWQARQRGQRPPSAQGGRAHR